MQASEKNQKSLEDLEEATRQLDVKLLLATEELRRDLGDAFEHVELGMSYVTKAVREGFVEKAIASLERDPLRHFGFQRHAFLGFGASRHPDVRAALARLPGQIRALADLEKRRNALEASRGQVLARADARDLTIRSEERRRDDAGRQQRPAGRHMGRQRSSTPPMDPTDD